MSDYKKLFDTLREQIIALNEENGVSLPNIVPDLISKYKSGGKSGIYIKPENRGKFTETKKKTGKTTEELTHSKNPVTRKRAIFAQNAAKWNKK